MVDLVDVNGDKEGLRECTDDRCLCMALAGMKVAYERVELWN